MHCTHPRLAALKCSEDHKLKDRKDKERNLHIYMDTFLETKVFTYTTPKMQSQSEGLAQNGIPTGQQIGNAILPRYSLVF
jgi:hypothetical protein